ncbi:MAG TPA: VanZ family protein [Thermoanaerobaculia bacterium]
MTARARFLLWAPVALLLAFEFYLSSQSGHSLPTFGLWFPGMDKVEHLAYFFLTGLCAFRAARFGEGWSTGKTAVFLILTGLLWGCSDEIHQSYTPGRSVEIGDVFADTAGVALSVLIGEKILRRARLDQTVR